MDRSYYYSVICNNYYYFYYLLLSIRNCFSFIILMVLKVLFVHMMGNMILWQNHLNKNKINLSQIKKLKIFTSDLSGIAV